MRTLYGIVPLMFAVAVVEAPPPAHAQISIGVGVSLPGVTVAIAPPELPVYVQPPIPEPGYLWTPGYWAYDASDSYYWVPGTWVQPPEAGYLWTPGYWGWNNGSYAWNGGYWGEHVGFYGGINYGYGYGGRGYQGGRWNGGHFEYNNAVNNFGNVHVTNVYHETVNNYTTVRVAFNGGRGGVNVRPSQDELIAARDRHIQATADQTRNIEAARANPSLRYATNHGAPPIAAVREPGRFTGEGVVAARGAVARPVVAETRAPAAVHEVPRATTAETARPGYRPETTAAARPAYHPATTAAARPAYHPEATVAARPAYHPEATVAARPAYHPESTAAARPAYHPESTERQVEPTAHAAARPEEHAAPQRSEDRKPPQ